MTPIQAQDYHTAGEPFRIVVAGLPEIPGASVLDRRDYAMAHEEIDVVRRMLCHEPRGHADMYGCFVVPPDDAGADFGVLFWHKDGYSTACGHGTIALGEWAVRSGLVDAADDGVTQVTIDVPSGRVVARVLREGGVTQQVTFRNVPSHVIARGVVVPTSRGPVEVDVSFGGAIYASLPAAAVDARVSPEHLVELIALGREIKADLEGSAVAGHSDPRLAGIYGTIWFDDLGRVGDAMHQRNVTIFADGEVDRSPCGSGTSARLALLDAAGALPAGGLVHDSIIDTTFHGRVVERLDDGSVVTEISGMAYPTGEGRYWIDPADPLGTGFTLR